MKIKLDPWQEEVMKTKGNLVLRSGRQVGKSTVIGLKAAEYALKNKNKLIMVISKTEKQAHLLFTKILVSIQQMNEKKIMKGADRPIKTRISLTNGSIIYCLCAGDTGYGIMGYTIDLLIADEAAFIPEEVWYSITPSLAISKGNIWLLSTPFIKEGYYYNCFEDPTFTSFHMSTEDCPRRDDKFLAHKKKTLTKARYAQMYLGEFRDELKRYFSKELIKEICTSKRKIREGRDYFLGVDVAGMGDDDSTFEILDGTYKHAITQVESIITSKTRTTDTTEKIINLNRQYNFNRIGIDSGGMGAGVFDQLFLNKETRRKTKALNNASKDIDFEEERKITLLKEDMYANLRGLMERREITLLDDQEIKDSLYSVLCESLEGGRLKMHGEDTHIAEGLIRAAWVIKTRGLRPYVY